jgi:hypothetical protein
VARFVGFASFGRSRLGLLATRLEDLVEMWAVWWRRDW